jgi:hypothetical protein
MVGGVSRRARHCVFGNLSADWVSYVSFLES